jgi:hypothetical protein
MSSVFRVVVLVVALAAVAGCRRNDAPKPSTDTPLAFLARPTLGGGTLDVSPLAGKVVLVNFWSPG